MSWRKDKRTSAERGYGHRWRVERQHFLNRNPLCVYCMKQGRVTQATVVDHIIPHRGDAVMFWDAGNWQALCADCHNVSKQQEEVRGYTTATGLDGWPTDAKHPINKQYHDVKELT